MGLSQLHALRWSSIGHGGKQLIDIISRVVLARLLLPEDFGIYGLAAVLSGIASYLAQGGLGAALIHERDIEPRHVTTALFMSAGAGALLYVGIFLAAPVYARAFDSPQITPLLRLAAVEVVLRSFGSIGRSLYFRYGLQSSFSIIEISSHVVGLISAVAVASIYAGPWGLVVYAVVPAAVEAAAVWKPPSMRQQLAATPSRPIAKDLARYSLPLVGVSAIGFGARSIDNLLVGGLVGPSALGYYRQAYGLSAAGVGMLGTIGARVFFPALSSVRRISDAEYSEIYRRGVGMIAVVSVPLFLLVSILSEAIIVVLFGKQWLPSVPVLRILALAATIQPIESSLAWLLQSSGRTKLQLALATSSGVTTALFVAVGILWGGVEGVAWGLAAKSLVFVVLTAIVAGRLTRIRPASFLLSIGRVIVAAVLGVAPLATAVAAHASLRVTILSAALSAVLMPTFLRSIVGDSWLDVLELLGRSRP